MKSYLANHPPVRSALRVFAYAFLAQFSLSLLGFIADVSTWAATTDADFPSITPLGKAMAAAFSSALAGLIGFIYNKLPRTTTAQYPTTDGEG